MDDVEIKEMKIYSKKIAKNENKEVVRSLSAVKQYFCMLINY